MIWATTGRICEDLYFAIRHYFFQMLAAIDCCWLPFIREAEKQLKPYDKNLHPRYNWIERAGLGFKWPMVIFCLPIILAVLLSLMFDFPLLIQDTSDPSILSGVLKTTGAILATLTAILLAVIALAIQTNLANLPGANFLLGAFARKRGFVPIAALLLGVLVTIVAGIVSADLFALKTLSDWTFISLLSSLVSAILLFDLFRRTIQTLGQGDIAEFLRTELTNSWREYTRSYFRRVLYEICLRKRLAVIGFVRHTAQEKESHSQIEFHLIKNGRIVAIDLVPLRRISKLLRLEKIKPNLDLSYNGWIADRQSSSPSITVPVDGNITVEKSLALLVTPPSVDFPETISHRVNKLIQSAFVLQRYKPIYFNWRTLQSLLIQAIDRRDSALAKTALNTYQVLFEEHLAVFTDFSDHVKANSGLPPDDFIMEFSYNFRPPHPSQLDLSDLAMRAVANNTPDCLDEIFDSVFVLTRISFERDDVRLFHDMIFQMYWSYRLSPISTETAKISVRSACTRRLPWISRNILEMYLFENKNSLERIEKLKPFAIHYYSLCLHLLKSSAERYDQTTFDSVVENIVQFLKHEIQDNKAMLDIYRNIGQGSRSGAASQNNHIEQEQELLIAYNELYDHKSLVYVITGAWLMHKVKLNKLEAEKVAPFIEKLIDSTGDLRSLLDLYAMPGMGGMTSSHDNPLGFDGWDWPYSPYPSVRTGTDFGIWIKPFYQFLLLKETSRPDPVVVNIINIRKTEMASHESLKRFLGEIATESYNLPDEYQNKPWSLEPGELEAGKNQLKTLLSSWSNEQDSTSA